MPSFATALLAALVAVQPARPAPAPVAASLPAAKAPTVPQASTTPPASAAIPSRHELYLSSGFTFYSSERRLVAGLGGGPGYRLAVTDHLTLHAEGRFLFYLGRAFSAAAGFAYAFRFGQWEPAVGAQALLVTGDSIGVLTTERPGRPPSSAWAAQVRLAPLRFTHAPFTASALEVDLGFGDDVGARAFALTVSFLSIGVRL